MRHGRVYLIGPSGAGKSTVGAPLAAALGLPFVDLDAMVERDAGRSIARQFAEDGEPAFRARERAALEALAAGPPAVVAVGAGAPLDPAIAALLPRAGRVVLLDALPATLADRLGAATDRPLLAGARDLTAQLAAQRAARDPAYRAIAERAFATDALAPAEVAAAIAAWLAAAPR
jgi:shikimate kinase